MTLLKEYRCRHTGDSIDVASSKCPKNSIDPCEKEGDCSVDLNGLIGEVV